MIYLPSHDSVTSASKSDLNKFENVMAKFDEYEFHFKQNCCWGSMMCVGDPVMWGVCVDWLLGT